jgi:hypothetical protein
MRTFDTFKLWQQFERQIGSAPLFAWTRIPAWALNDNFVHVWSHYEFMVNG